MAASKQLTGDGAITVNVVTPRGPVISGKTDAVTAPGEMGEFEVLPGHVPFLTTLHPGVLTIGDGAPHNVYAVSRGYLRVSQNGEIEVLVEQAIAGSDVDIAAAEADLTASKAELEQFKDKTDSGEWLNIADRAGWAQARVDARKRAAN